MIKHFFTNSIGIFVSRILGFLRDLLIAANLGASLWSDIFIVAFKLPNLFRRLFGEGAFTQAFLPHLVKTKQKGLFIAQMFVSFSLVMLVLSLIVMILAPLFTKILAFGFDDDTIKLATPLVRINFWYLFLIFMVTLFASILQYKNHFATSAFSTSLLNISMISSLLLAHNLDASISVYYLSYGVVIGGLLQVILHIYMLKKLKLFSLFYLGMKKFFQGKRIKNTGFSSSFLAGVLGSSASQLNDFLSSLIASFLISGSISYLYYTNRIFQLPLALFAIALSTAIFPKISKQIKEKQDDKAYILLKNSFYILSCLLIFASIGGIIFAKPIIWLLFQRGEFNAQNTIDTAFVLQMTMLGLLPFGLYKLFSLWLFAKMKQKLAAKISFIALFINVILCLFLFDMGAGGLALASSISGYFIFFAGIYYFGFKNFILMLKDKKMFLIIIASIFITIIFYIINIKLQSFLGI